MSEATPDWLFEAAQRRARRGDLAGAAVLLEELLGLQPHRHDARILLARTWIATNPTAAANLVHPVVQADPDDVEALTELAMALSAMGRHDEAAIAFGRLAERQADSAGAQANLALALTRAGRPKDAVAAGERAVALDPDRPEAHANLGHAFNLLHESAHAIEAFERAIALKPDFADALVGVSRAYAALGRPSEAVNALQRAVRAEPSASTPQSELASLYRDLGEVELARRAQRTALELAPKSPALLSNRLLWMNYDPDVDDRAAARAAFDWGVRQLERSSPLALPPRDLSPDRVLRVGYVSADFYRHPVGWLGSAPIAAHDRNAVHVTLYANSNASDEITERLRRAADAWVPVTGLDDASLAARIAADGIDILVDLSGHTSGNRLAAFALRPAPVQVSWLGYFATTGLPTIDYLLMDDFHMAGGADEMFSETVVRLPNCRFCYSPPPDSAELRPDPYSSARPVTFGSFNNVSKLNAEVIALWARVLKAAPESSTLLLKWRSLADPKLQQTIRQRFARHGVDPARLRFDGASSHADMLRQYGDVDVALDPFPFSGGLTTCEALWMGVPLVTLPGRRPVSRQSHAVLSVIGRPEWSAGDPDAYVEIAASLAADAEQRRRLRQELPRQMAASPLCDAEAFARNLEAAYRLMWRETVATLQQPSPAA